LGSQWLAPLVAFVSSYRSVPNGWYFYMFVTQLANSYMHSWLFHVNCVECCACFPPWMKGTKSPQMDGFSGASSVPFCHPWVLQGLFTAVFFMFKLILGSHY
jgi:hypothetical protein